ncbi:Avirulence (Avh) protein [Phytophthora megakarya]|uniref:Avirulence (Avh) protein n=1 Tax=Phytophthora megakarya TaxID=4795 RepID=A0A225WQ87_9STRA|nr:Avirulence (Avh) protein [Phytophthora megakarya]
MLATLSTHYKEDALTQLLIAARKNPSTEDLVITLQAEQLRIKYNNRESYGDVFNLLKLNKAGNQLFDNPDFPVWMKYVRRGRVETIFPILSTYYTDDVLAQLFIAAKKISGTENIATKLQAEQLQIWLRKQKSADDVFTLLQLNKVDNKLFDTPEFALWSKYIDDLKISNKESAMLSILKTHYSEEAMIKLVHSRKAPLGMKSTVMGVDGGKMQEWLKAGTFPDDVFKAYELNKAGDDLLISPQLDRWASYVSKFNYENPSKKTAMVDTLTHYYGDENLAQMLIAAKGVVKTESIATDLQIMQLKYWLRMKEDPQLVYNWMGIADRGPDDVERKLFEKFFTKITSLNQHKRCNQDS